MSNCRTKYQTVTVRLPNRPEAVLMKLAMAGSHAMSCLPRHYTYHLITVTAYTRKGGRRRRGRHKKPNKENGKENVTTTPPSVSSMHCYSRASRAQRSYNVRSWRRHTLRRLLFPPHCSCLASLGCPFLGTWSRVPSLPLDVGCHPSARAACRYRDLQEVRCLIAGS